MRLRAALHFSRRPNREGPRAFLSGYRGGGRPRSRGRRSDQIEFAQHTLPGRLLASNCSQGHPTVGRVAAGMRAARPSIASLPRQSRRRPHRRQGAGPKESSLIGRFVCGHRAVHPTAIKCRSSIATQALRARRARLAGCDLSRHQATHFVLVADAAEAIEDSETSKGVVEV